MKLLIRYQLKLPFKSFWRTFWQILRGEACNKRRMETSVILQRLWFINRSLCLHATNIYRLKAKEKELSHLHWGHRAICTLGVNCLSQRNKRIFVVAHKWVAALSATFLINVNSSERKENRRSTSFWMENFVPATELPKLVKLINIRVNFE